MLSWNTSSKIEEKPPKGASFFSNKTKESLREKKFVDLARAIQSALLIRFHSSLTIFFSSFPSFEKCASGQKWQKWQ